MGNNRLLVAKYSCVGESVSGTILVIASIGIAVATGGASIGPEAQLLGGVSALAAAAKLR